MVIAQIIFELMNIGLATSIILFAYPLNMKLVNTLDKTITIEKINTCSQILSNTPMVQYNCIFNIKKKFVCKDGALYYMGSKTGLKCEGSEKKTTSILLIKRNGEIIAILDNKKD